MTSRALPLLPLLALAALVTRLGVAPEAFDAGELAAAAWDLGGSHPPGQALHALLGHAAALLPLGSIGFRLALFEAGTEVLGAWIVARIVARALRDDPLATLAAAVAFVATLAAPALLRQACRIEVYGLALALSLRAVEALIAWADGDRRALHHAALLTGLAFAVHPPHALAALATGAGALLVRGRTTTPRAIVHAAMSCATGMLVLVYLPVRALAGAPMWGDAATPRGLLAYLSGSAYAHKLNADHTAASATLLDVVAEVGAETSYVALVVGAGLLALVVSGRVRDARARALALAIPACVLPGLLQPLRPMIPDAVAYLAPLVAVVVAAAAIGVARATRAARPALRVLALCALANPLALSRAAEATYADVPALETLTAEALDVPTPRALVIVETDFIAATWWSARTLDGARPDVALFVTGLATSSWHFASLAPHPAFDGRPIRGREADARLAYVRGPIEHAMPRVPVFVEPSWPTSDSGDLAGPYLVVQGPVRVPVVDRFAAGRRALAAARYAPLGDHDVAGEILRYVALERATRLAMRGDGQAAIRSLGDALPPPSGDAMRAFRGTVVRPPVPLVEDPRALLASPGDLVRYAATLADASGRADLAVTWLAALAEEGDPIAHLELAWIALAHDDPARARALVDAFLAASPEDHALARPLRSRLP